MGLATECMCRNHEFVRGWMLAEYGVEVSTTEVADAFSRHAKYRGFGRTWTDGTWRMWLLNRFRHMWAESIGEMTFPDVLTVELNTFFISIVETPSMLERLRRPDDHSRQLAPARSRISKYKSEISPVDRTAMRVGPNCPRTHRND